MIFWKSLKISQVFRNFAVLRYSHGPLDLFRPMSPRQFSQLFYKKALAYGLNILAIRIQNVNLFPS